LLPSGVTVFQPHSIHN
jgi:hypothetical protein